MTYYIDFDGVILDTMPLYDKAYEDNHLENYADVFKYVDKDDILNIKRQINNSIDILKKYQSDNVILLSKVNGIDEEKAKDKFLLDNGINIKTIYVPYEKSKTDFVNISNNTVLIDDDIKNIDEWISKGGKAYLFSKRIINGYNCIDNLNVISK